MSWFASVAADRSSCARSSRRSDRSMAARSPAAPDRQAHRHRRLAGDLWLVLHLMIAGRLHWRAPDAKLAGRNALLALDFADGIAGPDGGGLEASGVAASRRGRGGLAAARSRWGRAPGRRSCRPSSAVLRRENHTLKRALTDPRLFAGIGNAYSDEILHAAGLSPSALTATAGQCSRSPACFERRSRRWATGPNVADAGGRGSVSREGDRVPAPAWPCMAAIGQPCPAAARRCSGFAMRTTRPTTARAARPAAGARATGPVPALGIRLATHDRGARGAV